MHFCIAPKWGTQSWKDPGVPTALPHFPAVRVHWAPRAALTWFLLAHTPLCSTLPLSLETSHILERDSFFACHQVALAAAQRKEQRIGAVPAREAHAVTRTYLHSVGFHHGEAALCAMIPQRISLPKPVLEI